MLLHVESVVEWGVQRSPPREMKQKAHALYPIQNYGGPQRLLATAVSREDLFE